MTINPKETSRQGRQNDADPVLHKSTAVLIKLYITEKLSELENVIMRSSFVRFV